MNFGKASLPRVADGNRFRRSQHDHDCKRPRDLTLKMFTKQDQRLPLPKAAAAYATM